MRRARTGLQVTLIVGAVVLSAPAALAAPGGPSGDVRVTPRHATPGTTVTVRTTACGKETYGKGESEVGGKFHLFQGDRPGVLEGEFRVPDDAASGMDTVTLKCPPRIKQTVTYRISGLPNGAVEAGFGWAAEAAGESGAGAARTGIALGGTALIGGALAVGAIRMRRRSPGGRTAE
ncbi:sortase [Streptomyces sp. NPDC058872]|uniref:sortase n=1 Tax=Streptomyces sp. NPDC058872 TaxID=3346661 RepID=UPI0036A6B720